ncbi:hypothetical protein D1AOALGA4SA_10603 [Olavius algarvensis Delta 1 endosymbiont]|nr:hypothetical protein D1AOALGA4SA_10603 [Olavius algarvensis Delta 1 endosymbiont]
MVRLPRMGSNLITAGQDSKGNLERQPNPAKPKMKTLCFYRDESRKKWSLRAKIAKFMDFRFSAEGGSGFGCQGTEVLNPLVKLHWNVECRMSNVE